VSGFAGFSANAANPFDGSTSRIRPFYEFDIASVGWMPGVGLAYWPKVLAVTDKTAGPMVYFRAENASYTINGLAANGLAGNSNNVKTQGQGVWPAYDTRYSTNLGAATAVVKWVNDQSFQIFSSGVNVRYGSLTGASGTKFYGLAYPTGDNYATDTYDDITSFSSGTLESDIPQ
jgi:hypothetical protein